MRVDWSKVPKWVAYVTCDNWEYRDGLCYGWCSKPEARGSRWYSYYGSEDYGLVCELPWYVADGEEGDVLVIEERPKDFIPIEEQLENLCKAHVDLIEVEQETEQENEKLKKRIDFLEEELFSDLWCALGDEETGELDNCALSCSIAIIKYFVEHGKLEIVEEVGRRIIARRVEK